MEVKPSIRARKIQEEKMRKQMQKEEYWRRREEEERWRMEIRFVFNLQLYSEWFFCCLKNFILGYGLHIQIYLFYVLFKCSTKILSRKIDIRMLSICIFDCCPDSKDFVLVTHF